jgi:AraC family transcriptional regulator
MEAHKDATHRGLNFSEIDDLCPNSGTVLPWRGFAVKKHFTPMGVLIPESSDACTIWRTRCPLRIEGHIDGRRFYSMLKPPGSITIVPKGPVPRIQVADAAELVSCTFTSDFLHDIEEELGPKQIREVNFKSGLQDSTSGNLLNLLLQEMESGGRFGTFYAESIARALIARLLLVPHELEGSLDNSSLPAHILRRVQERIEADLPNQISLQDLAMESGYRRTHFLRLLRASTGQTPYQYGLGYVPTYKATSRPSSQTEASRAPASAPSPEHRSRAP